ncbi:hypothetical protein [Cognatiluteimonas telluris]|uniref:hypothetical protein n=1 Tax=Cognatiluteimonas telluris TaxID=1104775 RepID=UPI00140B1F9D|nr:hypothetical protein [Lysobacter telluris]
MRFDVPNSDWGDELKPIVEACRLQFTGDPSPQMVLGVADMIVAEAIGDNYILIPEGGGYVCATIADLDRIERSSIVRFIAGWFDVPEPVSFVLRDGDLETTPFSISSRKFYAAMALAEAFNLLKLPDPSKETALRCGMYAGAVGVPSTDDALKQARRAQAAFAAKQAVQNNPKVAAMLRIKEEWLSMANEKSVFLRDAEFARRMAKKYSIITSEGSIKNAISKWRKEMSLG